MNDVAGNLQINVITLIVYNEEHSVTLRNLCSSSLFSGLLYEVAQRSYRFIDKYNRPPQDHIYDLFSDILEGSDKSRAELFGEVLDELAENSESVQPDFVVENIRNFIQEQELKKSILQAADILQGDDEDKLEQVKSLMSGSMDFQVELFDPGIRLTDYERSLQFLDDLDIEFPTGIKELDARGIAPARKELFNFMASYGFGKTHFMVNLARHSLMCGKKVCHVTLEMSASRMAQRYYANLLGITKRPQTLQIPQFEVDDDGKLVDIWTKNVETSMSFTDSDIQHKIMGKTDKIYRSVKNLVIKEFPTGTLTINQLKAYLDMLAQTGFEPDLLIVDYLELMSIPKDKEEYVAYDRLSKEFRGIAGERNLAAVTVSQINREGSKAKKKGGKHIQASWDKLGTFDTNLVGDQTDAEAELGLARIIVDKARYDERISVLISQNYAMGQFVRDSHLLTRDSLSLLEGISGATMDEDL